MPLPRTGALLSRPRYPLRRRFSKRRQDKEGTPCLFWTYGQQEESIFMRPFFLRTLTSTNKGLFSFNRNWTFFFSREKLLISQDYQRLFKYLFLLFSSKINIVFKQSNSCFFLRSLLHPWISGNYYKESGRNPTILRNLHIVKNYDILQNFHILKFRHFTKLAFSKKFGHLNAKISTLSLIRLYVLLSEWIMIWRPWIQLISK